MKLRIKGSTIRLRLSQPEVKQIISGRGVQETVYFGEENIFKYSLTPDNCKEICADYDNNTIKVSVPSDQLKKWAENDGEVGFEHTIHYVEGTSLYILVEKDFKCLTDRPGEDESELFENPHEKHNC